MANISFNPQLTSAPQNSFLLETEGFVQGAFFDDPSARLWLAMGQIDASVTQAIWGGMAITEYVPTSNAQGNTLKLATSPASNITAFTVFNQANNMIITPGNTVQQADAGMSMAYFRLGSNARIAVQCDTSLASALDGNATNQQVSWDFNNQVLTAYDASTATVSVTSMTNSYASNVNTIAIVCAAASNVGAVGDLINISGATNTGTGGNAAVNGNFVVTAFTDNEHFSIQVPGASGYIGTIAGTIVLNQGTGALPVKVLGVNTNSKVVSYNDVTGAVTWAVGPAVIIQI